MAPLNKDDYDLDDVVCFPSSQRDINDKPRTTHSLSENQYEWDTVSLASDTSYKMTQQPRDYEPELSEKQEDAVQEMLKGRNVFLTGKPQRLLSKNQTKLWY